jgi:TPR repeat protein
MRKPFFAGLLLLVLAVLPGCELHSDKPLLDPSSGVPIAEKGLSAFKLNRADGFINTKGEYEFLKIEPRGTRYAIVGGNSRKTGTLSFHPAPGPEFDYLIQITNRAETRTSYFAARRTDYGLDVYNLDLSGETADSLRERGIPIEYTGMYTGYRVDSRAAFDEAVQTWTKHELSGPDVAAVPHRFRIADTDTLADALLVQAKTESCLAQAGHPLEPAVNKLPGTLVFGVPLAKIDTKAAKKACLWDNGADAPDPVLYALARTYVQTEEYSKAIDLVKQLSDRKNPFAIIMLADMYTRGIVGERNLDTAKKLLEKGAEQHPLIAYYLGATLASGQFGEPDYDRARELYGEASAAGVAAAKVAMGLLYASGSGVDKNLERAYLLFVEGAKAKNLRGYLETGRALYFGYGTKANAKAAYGYLRTASDAGLADAQYLAGFMLAHGQGTKQNERAAVSLFKEASEAGISSATAELGMMTYQGRGVAKDEFWGHKLLSDAAKAGSATARKYLEEVGLTPFN